MTAATGRLRRLTDGIGSAARRAGGRAALALRGDLLVRGRDPLADAYVVFAAVWMVLVAVGYVGANDAVSWYAHRLPEPYDVADYRAGVGFFFAPPTAFVVYPLTLLPWPLYAALFVGLSLAALRYMAGRWALLLVLLPPVFWELEAANINLLIAAAVVFGLRRPAAWSFVLLTKVTPGVGLLWFAFRREWRSLAIALAATAGLAAVSFVVRPDLWSDWWRALTSNAGWPGPAYFTVPVPLVVRLASAVLVGAVAAITDRGWLVPVMVTLGLPVLWFNGLSILVAALPLWSMGRDPIRNRPGPDGLPR